MIEYEAYENGEFEVQVRPGDIYFIQHDVAGFFVQGTEKLDDLVVLLQAIIDEKHLGALREVING